MTAKELHNENTLLEGFSKPKRLDYEVHETDTSKRAVGIRHVVKHFCSEDGWEQVADEEMQITTLQGGLTNQLYLIQDASKERAALVRIYGQNTEVIIDRAEECIIFHILSEKNFGPRLFGLFKNGRVEGYVPAKALEPPQLGAKEPVDLPALICESLSRMHYLEMPLSREPHMWAFIDKFAAMTKDMAFPNDEDEQKRLDALQLPRVWEKVAKLKTELPSKLNGHGKELVEKACTKVERDVVEFLFEPVFCHNDLLAGNILLHETADRVQLIDFEYGKYNYRGFDFGNHFCEYAGFDFNLEKWYPDAAAQRHFLKHYIEQGASHDESLKQLNQALESDEAYADEFFSLCKTYVDKFALCANLLWGFWSLIQKMYSPIDFDYLDYARLRLSAVPLDTDEN